MCSTIIWSCKLVYKQYKGCNNVTVIFSHTVCTAHN